MYKKKTFRPKSTSRISLAKLAKKVSALKHEKELKESYTQQVTPTYSGVSGSGFQYTTQLSSVAEGDDYNNRTGRKIKPVDLDVRLVLSGSEVASSAATPPQPRLARVMIFQDMGYDGTSLAGTKLLQIYNNTADSTATALSHINTDYIRSKNNKDGRVHLLYDKTMWIHPVFSAYAAECSKYLHIRIPGKKLKEINYNGAADNTAVGGSIWMYICLGQASDNTLNSKVAFQSRLRFEDD